MSKLKRKFAFCMSNCKKTSTTFFLSWHSSVFFISYIRTVPSQFLHKQGLSFSSMHYLSFKFRTGNHVWLTTMGVKAWIFLVWLAKEERQLNPMALRNGPLRSCRGVCPPAFFQPHVEFCTSPSHLPHVLLSESNQFASAFGLISNWVCTNMLNCKQA